MFKPLGTYLRKQATALTSISSPVCSVEQLDHFDNLIGETFLLALIVNWSGAPFGALLIMWGAVNSLKGDPQAIDLMHTLLGSPLYWLVIGYWLGGIVFLTFKIEQLRTFFSFTGPRQGRGKGKTKR